MRSLARIKLLVLLGVLALAFAGMAMSAAADDDGGASVQDNDSDDDDGDDDDGDDDDGDDGDDDDGDDDDGDDDDGDDDDGDDDDGDDDDGDGLHCEASHRLLGVALASANFPNHPTGPCAPDNDGLNLPLSDPTGTVPGSITIQLLDASTSDGAEAQATATTAGLTVNDGTSDQAVVKVAESHSDCPGTDGGSTLAFVELGGTTVIDADESTISTNPGASPGPLLVSGVIDVHLNEGEDTGNHENWTSLGASVFGTEILALGNTDAGC